MAEEIKKEETAEPAQPEQETTKKEEKSEKELNWYYNKIFEYISEKEMIKTPDCSYAKFVREKFPFVWEKYENEN